MKQPYTHIVLGMGATGLSIVRFLLKQGITPCVMDNRALPPGLESLMKEFPTVGVVVGKFDQDMLLEARQIIISPGVSISTPEVKTAKNLGVEVVGDIELFARAICSTQADVIGITGSNGKSTVTTLVGDMAKRSGIKVAVGGNIGTPALDLLEQEAALYVLELSSFQLETTTSLNCLAATCLNISHDHMDRYLTFDSYRKTKLKLFDQTQYQVINRHDFQAHPLNLTSVISFGLDKPESQQWGVVDGQFCHGDESIMPTNEAAALGRHNQANILASMALAQIAGVKKTAMIEAASQFVGLSHRCENIAKHDGITFIDDSKATNVGAVVAAIDGLHNDDGNIILIAGGDAKKADLYPLRAPLERVKVTILFGQDAEALAELTKNHKVVENMKQAVTYAIEQAEDKDIVLLSPACASTDMYHNFVERGNDFKQKVLEHYGEH
ncbi:UDP-N-acetylmuramoyl-L-alanine--D-glutamate ligase [Parashewanella curva]|uniref:UDP-N-acetylmuramoylalanine--D-glutamate ligase n=1 Tax=Parashewanella curva TaxID=2338552 RepID=A0A3L8PWX8_9GAMM|nr:UDP-N-acetylmuramoyl-L-alanine--D-glutamate ligase [Parashewanella curva]RLV58948.1 UDP-N-acetylmuramoyl-L-alanine--D-glutamate ligase [Parashewanella curva]